MTDPIADLSAKLLHFERNQNELISRVEKLEQAQKFMQHDRNITSALVNGSIEDQARALVGSWRKADPDGKNAMLCRLERSLGMYQRWPGFW